MPEDPLYTYTQTCLYYKDKNKKHKGRAASKLDGTVVFAYFSCHDPSILKKKVTIFSESHEKVHSGEERVKVANAGEEEEGEGKIGMWWVERFEGKASGTLPSRADENKTQQVAKVGSTSSSSSLPVGLNRSVMKPRPISQGTANNASRRVVPTKG